MVGGHGKTNSAIRPVEGSGQPGGCRKLENLAPAWLQLLGWASACLWLSWSGHDQLVQSPGGGEGGGMFQRRERSISSQQPSSVTFSNCRARGFQKTGLLEGMSVHLNTVPRLPHSCSVLGHRCVHMNTFFSLTPGCFRFLGVFILFVCLFRDS